MQDTGIRVYVYFKSTALCKAVQYIKDLQNTSPAEVHAALQQGTKLPQHRCKQHARCLRAQGRCHEQKPGRWPPVLQVLLKLKMQPTEPEQTPGL